VAYLKEVDIAKILITSFYPPKVKPDRRCSTDFP